MSFATALEKATNESQQGEEWQSIMDFTDKVNTADEAGRAEAIQALIRRLNHANNRVQLHTTTVLSSCVKNCGRPFQISLCSNREFFADVKKTINNIKSDVTVVGKLKELLLVMQKEFRDSQQRTVAGIINSLKDSGIAFDDGQPASRPAAAAAAAPSTRDREEAELQRALAESLKLAQSKPAPSKGLGKARALYDFDAREENELSVRAGEVVLLLDTSDTNWWRGRNAAGEEGCFPVAYMTTDSAAAADGPVAASAPARPQSQEINEALLDQLMKSIAQLTPGQQAPPQLDELMAAHHAMKPTVKARVSACSERKRTLEDACGRFSQAMARYDAIMQAPLPAPPQPQPSQQYYAPAPAQGYAMPDPRLAASTYATHQYPPPQQQQQQHGAPTFHPASAPAPVYAAPTPAPVYAAQGYGAPSPLSAPPATYTHHSPSPALGPPQPPYHAAAPPQMAAWQYGSVPRT